MLGKRLGRKPQKSADVREIRVFPPPTLYFTSRSPLRAFEYGMPLDVEVRMLGQLSIDVARETMAGVGSTHWDISAVSWPCASTAALPRPLTMFGEPTGQTSGDRF